MHNKNVPMAAAAQHRRRLQPNRHHAAGPRLKIPGKTAGPPHHTKHSRCVLGAEDSCMEYLSAAYRARHDNNKEGEWAGGHAWFVVWTRSALRRTNRAGVNLNSREGRAEERNDYARGEEKQVLGSMDEKLKLWEVSGFMRIGARALRHTELGRHDTAAKMKEEPRS